MHWQKFLLGLMLTLIFGWSLLWLIPNFVTNTNASFHYYTLGVYAILSIFYYLIGNMASQRSNRNLFTVVIMSVAFVKLICAILLLFWARKHWGGITMGMLVQFFSLYVCFTVFVTWMLARIGKAPVNSIE